MTSPASRAVAFAREPSAVFAVVLVAAYQVERIRSAAGGEKPDASVSAVGIAALAALVFLAFRSSGQRLLAWALTSLLLLVLAFSAIGATARQRLTPIGVRSQFAAELPQVPKGLAQIANWLIDRPLTWVFTSPQITVGTDARIVIDGTPGASYAYLLMSAPQRLLSGTHIVVEGVIGAGGLSVGLQQSERWSVVTTVDRLGPFRSWIIVPSDGDYRLVVAYGVPARTRTHVELAPLTLWR